MSKILLAAIRNGSAQMDSMVQQIDRLTERLIPDNIKPNATRIIGDSNCVTAVFNPVNTLEINENSACVGCLTRQTNDWWKPAGEVPDGSFALFRSNENYVEVLTDILGSRSIWYYYSRELFVASTTQRAIIAWLQSFEFNDLVIPWMLYSGHTGPELSWDRRIRLLPGDSRLLLDRRTWKVNISTRPVIFQSNKQSQSSNYRQLKDLLLDHFKHLNPDMNKWILALSGGYDSRGLLLLLKDKPNLQAITWGLAKSIQEPGNDAQIAKLLCDNLGIQHNYVPTDHEGIGFDRLLDRYLQSGEGRVEQIGGYMDGFKIWADLFQSGYTGFIRGDHAFGWRKVVAREDLFRSMNLETHEGYSNLSSEITRDIPNQGFPDYFERQPGETFDGWRDRLQNQFRVPSIFAALNEIKSAYVEIFNPYISSSLVRFMRTLPDELRTNKILFKKIIQNMSPAIPFCKVNAILGHHSVVQTLEVAAYLKEFLSAGQHSLLPNTLTKAAIDKITLEKEVLEKKAKSIKSYLRIRHMLPAWSKLILSKTVYKKRMDFNLFAFRMVIIEKMNKLLGDDAKTF